MKIQQGQSYIFLHSVLFGVDLKKHLLCRKYWHQLRKFCCRDIPQCRHKSQNPERLNFPNSLKRVKTQNRNSNIFPTLSVSYIKKNFVKSMKNDVVATFVAKMIDSLTPPLVIIVIFLNLFCLPNFTLIV